MKKYIFCFQKIIKEIDNIYVSINFPWRMYTPVSNKFLTLNTSLLYFTFFKYIFRYF